MIVNHNVIKAVFTVFVFWWIVLGGYGLLQSDYEWDFLWEASASIILLNTIGLVSGIGMVWLIIWLDKKTQVQLLQGEVVRGLKCTIGELPLIAREPKMATELPDFSKVPDVPADFFPKWFAKYEQSHPAHVALMKVFLCIYQAHKELPATHVPGGHGGRSLLHHSLLAGYFMDKLAHTWTYKGLRDRSGKRVVLKLRDDAYLFHADDPLVALIGVAHDIGKIEAYIFDTKVPNKIVGIHHEHDLTGARMIARLPQAWSIPDVDRQAMFLSIAHYHHPMELPLSPDRRAIDDRTIALMELLIKADFVTSRVEAKGVEPTEAEYENEGQEAAVTSANISIETLWTAFTEIITEHGRVNGTDRRFNVGTLCLGKGFSKPMLLIKEDAIRQALVSRLHVPSPTVLGDGRYQITIDLLKMLDEKGILLKEFEGTEFSSENALWNVDFMQRTATGAKPEKQAGWSAVIVIDPKVFTRIEQMEPYWWFAVIQRGTMGAQRAKKGGSGATIAKKPRKTSAQVPSDDELVKQLEAARSQFSVLTPEEPSTTEAEVVAPNSSPSDSVPTTSHADANITEPEPPVLAQSDEQEASHTRKPIQSESSSDVSSQAAHPLLDDSVIFGDAGGATPSTIEQANDEPPQSTPSSAQADVVEPSRSIAPLDVKNGLVKAMAVAQERGAQLRELGADKYFVSCETLTSLAPEIDWAGCRYKIEQMCRAGKIAAMYVPVAESFGLAFSKLLEKEP